jgi:hypothetical protein
MVHLKSPDFQSIISILQKLPELQVSRERRLLLIAAGLDDYRIIGRLNWEGSTRSFTTELVKFLSDFGRITFDREALGVFLSYIREYIPDSEPDAQFLDDIIHKYSMNVATSSVYSIHHWQDLRDDNEIQEVIIGENTLLPIAFLEKCVFR